MSNIRGSQPTPTGWVGWIAFAGVIMMINGVMNAITGIAAIAKDEVYIAGSHGALLLDLTAFGWIQLGLGILLAVTGLFVIRGAVWAIALAILVTGVNMLTQMMELPSYPFWSLLIIAIDVLVLYALIVHSDEMNSLD